MSEHQWQWAVIFYAVWSYALALYSIHMYIIIALLFVLIEARSQACALVAYDL